VKSLSRLDICNGVGIRDEDLGSNSQSSRSERIREARCRFIVNKTSEETHLISFPTKTYR
jgi:hypothetical protein